MILNFNEQVIIFRNVLMYVLCNILETLPVCVLIIGAEVVAGFVETSAAGAKVVVTPCVG